MIITSSRIQFDYILCHFISCYFLVLNLSDKFMFISVYHDSFIYLHITYIIYICDVLAALQLFTFSRVHLSKQQLNIHANTLVSTLSLIDIIFTRQSHIILSCYDSQETLFHLKAKLTFIDKSTDLRDSLYSYQSIGLSI